MRNAASQRELDGHATPKWVLQSAARELLRQARVSEILAFPEIQQRSSLTT